MARLRYCRDVTVGVSSPEQAPFLLRAAERWQEVPSSYLRVISTASLEIDDVGVNGVKEVCHRTYDNTLFIAFFSWCLRLAMMLTCPRLTTSGSTIDCPGPKL